MTPDIATQRLYNQHIADSAPGSAASVVSWLVGVQAQDYAGSKWSVGLRWPGSTNFAVEQALDQKQIVRTWAMRGTLHLLAAQDIDWLLRLLAPRLIAGNARRYRQLELDELTLARGSELIAAALQDGRARDRAALKSILEAQGISTAGQRAPYLLQRASLDGLIAQTTAPRNSPLFVTMADRKSGGVSMNRDDALAQLALRYFSSHGPATLNDFAWWSGLLMADARAGLEAAVDHLEQETVAGQAIWFAPPEAIASSGHDTAALLPAFDEYLVAYRDRSAVLDAAHLEAWSRGKAMFSPSLILNSRVAGLWQRALKKDHVLVEITPFRPLTESEELALQTAVQAYGEFLGVPAYLG